MSWSLLLPACAITAALVTLAVGLRRIETELVALRAALRRSAATAVAADELHRAATNVAERAIAVDVDARRRIHRPWSRRPAGDR